MKLTRSAYLTYIDASFGGATPEWFLIGKDMEDMSVELNPDVSTKKNILDETSVQDNGYEPSMTADPYYANPDDVIYPHLRDSAMNRWKGDACKTKILEVIVEDTEDASHKAWTEDVIVKPTSYGGDTSGFQIPFSVSFDGGRKEGSVTLAAGRKPTFTEG